MKLIPNYIKQRRAGRLAKEQFFLQGLHGTKDRNGILLFVSIAEHYVEIIGDKGIHEKVGQDVWDQVIAEFVAEVKQRRYTQGFLKAIDSCSKLLIQHFPMTQQDENELPNHLIEI